CLMIPTRIDGAPLPAPKKLPADIARLVKFQAREIRLDCFEGDFRNLVEIVETKVRPKKATSSGWTDVLGGILSVLAEGQKQRAGSISSSEPAGGSTLARIIPGMWQLQIMYPNGASGHATALFESNGSFRAEGRGLATFRIDGTWHADSPDQLSLRGHQFDGFQTLPYHAVIGFSDISTSAMVGALNTGERTVWRRTR